MPTFHAIAPEVAGGLGPHTVMDSSKHPPAVSKVHYQFDGWLGDPIVESFPVYLVTEELAKRIRDAALTGVEFADAEVTTSDEFKELHPGKTLPPFVWLKPVGVAGRDDFGMGKENRLVVSDRALQLINATGPQALDVYPYNG